MDISCLDLSLMGKMAVDEIIVGHIRQLIQSKKLAHNEALPNGKELALRWGLGYVTVQEGLARCAREGLLVRSPGRGTIVNAQSSKSQNKNNQFSRQIYVVIQQREREKDLDFSRTDYFSRLLAGLNSELMKSGILTISTIVASKEQEKLFIESLAKNPVDLVIVLRLNDNDFLARIKNMSLPVILVDPHCAPEKNETLILQDEEKAARDAVNFLLSKGCRHIAPAIITNDKWVTHRRYEAVKKAIKGQYLKEFPDLAAGFLEDPEGAKTKIINILNSKERPDALLINDRKFYDFIAKIAEEINIKVPDELSFIQYSDNPNALASVPLIVTEASSYGASIGRIVYKMLYKGKENFYKPRTFYVPIALCQKSNENG